MIPICRNCHRSAQFHVMANRKLICARFMRNLLGEPIQHGSEFDPMPDEEAVQVVRAVRTMKRIDRVTEGTH